MVDEGNDKWVDKDAPDDRRGAQPASFTNRKYTIIVDALTTLNMCNDPDVQDDEVLKKTIKNLYIKFTDKDDVTNAHLGYQAAHFIDWWCSYVRTDTWSQNINPNAPSQRFWKPYKPEWSAYIKWHGKPPPPLHRLYCEFAWKAFWI